MMMLPNSDEYAEALDLCKKLAGDDLPSAFGDQIALMAALAVKVPAALDTIDELVRVNAGLRSGLKLACATVNETRALLGHEAT